MVPIKFQLDLSGVYYNVFVSIYAEDGTVALSHGGVEIGQGVNTKAVQVAAKMFDIPMERIKVKPCSTVTNPNGFPTGGSITSELICLVSSFQVTSVMNLYHHYYIILIFAHAQTSCQAATLAADIKRIMQ